MRTNCAKSCNIGCSGGGGGSGGSGGRNYHLLFLRRVKACPYNDLPVVVIKVSGQQVHDEYLRIYISPKERSSS